MKSIIHFFFLIPFLLFLVATTPLQKREEIFVTYLSGDKIQIHKKYSAKWNSLFIEDVIKKGDEIKTGQDSYCELQIIGYGILRLAPNSELSISEIHNNYQGFTAVFNLKQGKIFFNVLNRSKESQFLVQTPVGYGIVSGCQGFIDVQQDACIIATESGSQQFLPLIYALEKAVKAGEFDNYTSEYFEKTWIRHITVNEGTHYRLSRPVYDQFNLLLYNAISEYIKQNNPILKLKSINTNMQHIEQIELPLVNIFGLAIKSLVSSNSTDTLYPLYINSPLINLKQTQKNLLLSSEDLLIVKNLSSDKIITYSSANIRIDSIPQGAKVSIDGINKGTTPVEVSYPLDNSIKITLELEAYHAYDYKLKITQPDHEITLSLKPIENNLINQADPGKSQEKNKLTLISERNQIFTENIEPPVISHNQIVCTKENTLYIIDETGKISTKIITDSSKLTRPVIIQDSIIVGSSDGNLYAFDFQGKQLWKREGTGIQIFGASTVSGDDTLFLPSMKQGIQIYSSNGKYIDYIPQAKPIYSSPYFYGIKKILVYATEGKQIIGYDLENQKQIWMNPTEERIMYPLIGSENIVISTFRSSGKIFAFDPENGKVWWSKTIPGLSNTRIIPLLLNGYILLTSADKSITTVLWYKNGGRVLNLKSEKTSCYPYIDGDWIYIGTEKGGLIAKNYKNRKTYEYSVNEKISLITTTEDKIIILTPTKLYRFEKVH